MEYIGILDELLKSKKSATMIEGGDILEAFRLRRLNAETHLNNELHKGGATDKMILDEITRPADLRVGGTDMIHMKAKMDAFEKELSKIVGLISLKAQLRSWANQIMLGARRRTMGLQMGDIVLPHMAFLGNPGTGKTTVARMLGELLHMVGVITSNKVVEVQRSDLVGQYVGQTAIKTRTKINEAKGGILFVDEAYRLVPNTFLTNDFGLEALEEIMSFMDSGNAVVIFAGYTKQMQKVISANEGFRRRVTKYFHFDDFTCRDLAEMACIKMSNLGPKSPLYGFRLGPLCTVEKIEETIRQESSDKLRRQVNGGLVDMMLANARENLDKRSDFRCEDVDSLVTITLDDLVAGIRLVGQHSGVEPCTESWLLPNLLIRVFRSYKLW